MRGASTIIQTILLFMVVVAGLTLGMPWASQFMENAKDSSEIDVVKSQFEGCNEKIIETIRTGSGTSCTFAIEEGSIAVEEDGIYYSIDTKNIEMCDAHDWTLINAEKHIWQKCDELGETNKLSYKWSWDVAEFELIEGSGGRTLGFSRISVTGSSALIGVRKE